MIDVARTVLLHRRDAFSYTQRVRAYSRATTNSSAQGPCHGSSRSSCFPRRLRRHRRDFRRSHSRVHAGLRSCREGEPGGVCSRRAQSGDHGEQRDDATCVDGPQFRWQRRRHRANHRARRRRQLGRQRAHRGLFHAGCDRDRLCAVGWRGEQLSVRYLRWIRSGACATTRSRSSITSAVESRSSRSSSATSTRAPRVTSMSLPIAATTRSPVALRADTRWTCAEAGTTRATTASTSSTAAFPPGSSSMSSSARFTSPARTAQLWPMGR